MTLVPDWFSLILIVLTCAVVGWLLLRPFNQHLAFPGDWLAFFMAALTMGVVAIGWLALLLTEFGRFSLINLMLLCVLLSIGLFFVGKPLLPSMMVNGEQGGERWQRPFLLLWFVAALWLFFRPHQFIHGAADAGVYVNLSAEISQHGSLIIQDETLAQLPAEVAAAFLRPIDNPVAPTYLMPGFYVTGEPAGQITPQFYPLHPVWMAVAFSLGGLNSSLWLTSLWALLGTLAVYMFVRQIAPWQVAVLTLVGLSIAAMQVWFARYPTTEMLTQYLLWAGLWATAVWLGNRPQTNSVRSADFSRPPTKVGTSNRLWAVLAGSSLGAIFLVRIDVIFMLPILILALFWLWLKKQPGIWHFAVPFISLVVHSFIHALWQSAPYFFTLYEFGVASLVGNQFVLALLILLGLLGLGFVGRYQQAITMLVIRYQRPLQILTIAILLLLALYAWFIRPYPATTGTYSDQLSSSQIPVLDYENFIRLGWYLSPLGVWLGVLGICVLVWRVNRQTAVMLTVTLFFSLFYLWHIRNNPHQIYTMRRYVPATLPLFIFAAAYGLHAIKETVTRYAQLMQGAAYLLALLWLLGLGWSARGFISQVDFAGLPEQVAALNGRLQPHSVLIFNQQSPVTAGDSLGTPLHFMYGHDVYSLRQPDVPPVELVKTIESWHNNGRTVYWIGDTAWLTDQNVPFTEEERIHIETTQLETVYQYKPTAVGPVIWQLALSRIEP